MDFDGIGQDSSDWIRECACFMYFCMSVRIEKKLDILIIVVHRVCIYNVQTSSFYNSRQVNDNL